MRTYIGLVVGGLVVAALPVIDRAQTPVGPAFSLTTVASPAGDDSESPQLTVGGDRAILSWLENTDKGTTLKFAAWKAGAWSAAKEVVANDALVVNAADVPAVRALADGTLAAAWLEANASAPENDEAYDLRVAWSHDDGASWSPATYPHHDKTATQHGFASLFDAPGAGLGIVWLDGRATHGDKGDMALRSTTFGTDGKQRSEMVIDTRVCECCPTSVAATSEGPIVAFRNRSPQEIRDIYVSRLVSGRWTAPVAVHNDNWRISACPVNGPAVSAVDRAVAVAWFTAKDDDGHAFVAFSRDGGRTFGAPVRVDDASALGRVQVALLDDGSAAVGWVEFSEKKSTFRVRRVEAGGARSAAVDVADMAGTRYPRLMRAGRDVLLAWTEAPPRGASHVRTARVALP